MVYAVDSREVVKIYDGRVRALDKVTLQVDSGKVFALLGPNGSGKTTLMRILTTQISPTSGKVFVLGHDVVKDGGQVRRLVGYVPQEMSVWTDISGYENLLIYSKIYGMPSAGRNAIILEAMENIGLSDVANDLVKSYSGGMIRRLEIASALLMAPQILFLDEPTIGLDPAARKIVWEKLTKYAKDCGTSVFFNTHYMDEADLYSDEIGFISQGRIITLGTADELKHTVGGEVITLDLDSGVLDVGLRERLGQMAKDVRVDNSQLFITVDDAEAALPEIMKLIVKGGIGVKRISMSEPTLDDVFLKYAGSRVESSARLSEVKQVRKMIGHG
jgi:ABC-2 type transport system ATP-binding protein